MLLSKELRKRTNCSERIAGLTANLRPTTRVAKKVKHERGLCVCEQHTQGR